MVFDSPRNPVKMSDSADSDIFTGFRGLSNTTVAKFSPSGYYIAAGSTGGWVKIFASKRNEDGDYIEKAEYEDQQTMAEQSA